MNRLKEQYIKEVVPHLTKKFGYKNSERLPRIAKIVVSIGSGEMHSNKTLQEDVISDLQRITGQKPILTQAKQAISSFKLREGNTIGATVTLRNERMYDFLDKLISITIPRVRDFRGLSRKSFDKQGNYNLGFRDQSVFNEIPYESIRHTHGLQVTIQTSAKTPEEGMELLEQFGFPFVKLETTGKEK